MSVPAENSLDVEELFRVLAEHSVDYLVIGGVAAQVHGRRRTTKDLDVTPASDPENFERLAAALAILEAHPTSFGPGAPAPSAEQLSAAPIVPPLSTRHGELHILNDVPGADPYSEMRARSLTVEINGVAIQIVSVDDLIRMKRATGRPSDLEDVQAITAVSDSENSNPPM